MFSITATLSSEKINALLLRLTAFCWLMAKLIGWRMFTTYRIFPTAPVLNIFDSVPAAGHTVLFVVSILAMTLLLFKPLNKPFLVIVLVSEVLSCLLDQNRVQPWDYQYLFILFIFLINAQNQPKVISAFLFVLASTYFYSGLGKLNTGFLQSIWSKMLLEQFLHLPPKTALQPSVQFCGYLAGIFELVLGAGLLFNKTRKFSAGVLILMHLFILVFLGPFGLKYNRVVWPWNVAMLGYLYLVCFKTEIPIDLSGQIFRGRNLPVLICWGILPALSFIGCWDYYLSSNIYSGNLPQMTICIRDTSKCKPLQRYCIKGKPGFCDDEWHINFQYWAMTETKMAPYPEIRAYKKIQTKLEKQFPLAGLTFIYFDGVNREIGP